MAVRIQLRRDTLTNWSTNNPILAEGEMGLEKDTGRWKVGNGLDVWNNLPYSNSIFSGPSVITDNSGNNALRITQIGTGNAFIVEDSTNPDNTPFVINNIGNVGIGTASPSALLDVSGTGSFSGILYAPTASVDTGTTQVATTAFVLNQANSASATITMNGTRSAGSSKLYARADHVHPTDTSRAPLSSPTFTGTPTAPTASVDTGTTQIATTAYVISQASGSNPLALGSIAQGTSTRYARQDHVHPTTGLGLTSGTLGQFAATTSSQLAGVISDETGTGSLVFANSPSLITPNIGVANGTSFNNITGLSSTNPAMNGTVAVGTATAVARADHVHPSDTSRAPLASPTFTGTVTAPTISLTTADTATASSHYIVETASDGIIRPKTLANVQSEIVTNTTMQSNIISPTAAGSNGIRKITMSTSAPTGGSDGDVWLVYA